MRTSLIRARGLVLLAATLLALLTALVPTAAPRAAAETRVAIVRLLQGECTEADKAFAMPYETFVKTQGPHGQSYGHAAFDLAAGRGTSILSPINGTVTFSGLDSLGNTTLIIKNTCYEVLMYHGRYSVSNNQSVEIGNVVGTESNQGNTEGSGGKKCQGDVTPKCGNHTHLNVKDVVSGQNLDIYDLVSQKTELNGSVPQEIENVLPDSPAEGWGDLVYGLWSAWLWIVIAAAVFVFMFAVAQGAKFRVAFLIIGVIFLAYAWILPSETTWAKAPVAGPITSHYGDIRIDPLGTTGTTWDVTVGTKVLAVAPGIVINTSDALEDYFGYQQIWVDTGNGLFIQYAMPEGTTKSVIPGTQVSAGDQIGVSAGGEIRLGVSSKHPDLFEAADDRGYGWLDPEQYLGQTTLSGSRKNEAVFMQLGMVLLIVALFWPGKTVREEYPFPWDWKSARFQNYQLVLGLCILSLGISMDGPWFIWTGGAPVVVSLIYFIGRLRYRSTPAWRVSLPVYLGSILSVLVELSLLLNMSIGALVNPNLLFVRRSFALDLPDSVIVPYMPDWLREYIDEGGDPTPWTPSPSARGRPEPFLWTYWNGSQIQLTIPQEVWDAAVAAYEKHGQCEPELLVSISWSENPHYTNVCNSIDACGDHQFMPGTWDYYWPNAKWRDPTEIPTRLDREANADAACRKVNNQGLSTATDEATFIDRFTRNPLKESIWNAHDGQARSVWETWQELKRRKREEPPVEEPSPAPNLAGWTVIDQDRGATLYQSGNNWLAVADLSQGSRVVLTGDTFLSGMKFHWEEMGPNPFFWSNGTFFEGSGLSTFFFRKNGVDVAYGAKTDTYGEYGRYLVLDGDSARVISYADLVSGTRTDDMIGGLVPSSEPASYYTMIGVSADERTVTILQVYGTPYQGVEILQGLWTSESRIPEDKIILFDGGSSVQGKYRNGYTRNHGRPVATGIGITLP